MNSTDVRANLSAIQARINALFWVLEDGRSSPDGTPRKAAAAEREELIERARRLRGTLADLERKASEDAQREVEDARRTHRATVLGASREHLAAAVESAELFCAEVLAGAKEGGCGLLDDADVAERMKARPEVLPHTLADCLHELHFWGRLYRLRWSVCRDGADSAPESYAREVFVLGQMAHIRPRSRDEAAEVLRYLAGDADRMGTKEAPGILRNLIA